MTRANKVFHVLDVYVKFTDPSDRLLLVWNTEITLNARHGAKFFHATLPGDIVTPLPVCADPWGPLWEVDTYVTIGGDQCATSGAMMFTPDMPGDVLVSSASIQTPGGWFGIPPTKPENGAGPDLRIRICRLSIRIEDWVPNASIYCFWTIGWKVEGAGVSFGEDFLYAQLSEFGPSEMPLDIPGEEGYGGGGGGGGAPPVQPPEPAMSIESGDIMWQSPNGFVTAWTMNGFAFDDAMCVGTPNSPVHVPAGRGDLDGDGDIDFVFFNSANHSAQAWIMQDGFLQDVQQIGTLNYPSPTEWEILGVGDVNADGRDDIVWRHSDGGLGKVRVWLLNGAIVTASADVGISPGFKFLGFGDLNGDGKKDILWRLLNGVVLTWPLNGTNPVVPLVFGGVGTISQLWNAESFCDLDGDGDDDIVWRKTNTGLVKGWIVQDFGRLFGGIIAPNVIPLWSLTTAVDLDDDGDSDLVWHNPATGMVNAWKMNGLVKESGTAVQSLPPGEWLPW